MNNLPKVLLLLCLTLSNISFNLSDDYYPTDNWRTSTPEEQGVDSEKLYQMLQFVKDENLNLHSLLIIRNGYLIHETYFQPYHKDVAQNICSCTKSFISALVGIALNEGKIKSLDQKVMELFPEKSIINKDGRKEQITIKHLLTMTAGMDWDDLAVASLSQKKATAMQQSKDWVEYVLNCPMITEPGLKFSYNGGGTHLLSAIIQKSTGVKTYEYTVEHLFKPLNISVRWPKDPNGIASGPSGIIMTPTDMAKFGYLYLNKGKWAGKQLIPAEWVEVSTKKQVDVILNDQIGYGYQWWINSWGGYNALGRGEQFIHVFPKSNAVIVFTAGMGKEKINIGDLIEKYILPAVKQDQPLPTNPAMMEKLEELSNRLEFPESTPLKTLPEIASRISGKVFTCEPNHLGFRELSLIFKDGTKGKLKVITGNETLNLSIGLDGVYRYNKISENYIIACRGNWTGSKFTFNWQVMNQPEGFQYELIFSENQVNIIRRGTIEKSETSFKGNLGK